jgi:hypothetical protein
MAYHLMRLPTPFDARITCDGNTPIDAPSANAEINAGIFSPLPRLQGGGDDRELDRPQLPLRPAYDGTGKSHLESRGRARARIGWCFR